MHVSQLYKAKNLYPFRIFICFQSNTSLLILLNTTKFRWFASCIRSTTLVIAHASDCLFSSRVYTTGLFAPSIPQALFSTLWLLTQQSLFCHHLPACPWYSSTSLFYLTTYQCTFWDLQINNMVFLVHHVEHLVNTFFV